MNSNFDLDINNYSLNELKNFLQLDDNYNPNDIEIKVNEITNDIFQVDKSSYDPKYKFDIINFVRLAKDILISAYNDIQTEREISKVINRNEQNAKKTNQVGKIINPLGVHQALQTQSIPYDTVDPYRHNRTKLIYVFNTSARDNFFQSGCTNCSFTMPTKLKNVISISISSVQIPNVMLTFSADRQTNQIYIYEDNTGINGIITIPDGNYSRVDSSNNILPFYTPAMSVVLEKAINDFFGGTRFQVTIDPASNRTTISNTTNTFTMDILKKSYEDIELCNSNNTNIDDYDYDKKIKPSAFISTLGYLLGYRNFAYSGNNSYTSEGTFNNIYSSYLYFALDDHTSSQTITNTYGVLQDSLINDNVLGVIPMNSSPFEFVFDNNSNFIYKKRDYFGPVDISKISIKILNQSGAIVNLLQNEFSFSLEVTTIYDLKKPFMISNFTEFV
jgi:hypothetical protein